MKTVFCTIGGSLNDVCHISTAKMRYPDNWPGNTRQDECHSIDDIKKFIIETRMTKVMFGIRANGIPNRAVEVSNTEKLEKAFKRFEKVLNNWP